MLGAFGTAVSVINALKVYYLMSAVDRGETAGSPESVLVFIAISLPVAIFTCCGSHLLGHQVAALDLEMRTTTLDLLNHLARCRQG